MKRKLSRAQVFELHTPGFTAKCSASFQVGERNDTMRLLIIPIYIKRRGGQGTGSYMESAVVGGRKRLKPKPSLCSSFALLYVASVPSQCFSFTLQRMHHLFYNFISFAIFYFIPLPSVRFWRSSSTARLLWKLPFVQHLRPLCLVFLTGIRNCSKSYIVCILKTLKVAICCLVRRAWEFD